MPGHDRDGFGEDFAFGLAALVGEGDGGALQLGDVGAGKLLAVAEALVLGAQGAGAELQVEQAVQLGIRSGARSGICG